MLNLLKHRWLFYNLFSREIQNRYVGSFSGVFWALLHPLLNLAIYAVVFATIFKVKLPELGDFDFTTFIALGLWPWLMFQEGVQRGMMAVQGNSNLVKKVAFPHEILVYASTVGTWVIHLGGYALVIVALSVFDQALNVWAIPAMLILLMALLCFTLSLALVLSALQALFRDVEQFITPIMMVWFYATPVLYPVSIVPDWLKPAMLSNPVGYIIERIRQVLMGDAAGLRVEDMYFLIGGLLMLWLARVFFNKLSPYFEDFL